MFRKYLLIYSDIKKTWEPTQVGFFKSTFNTEAVLNIFATFFLRFPLSRWTAFISCTSLSTNVCWAAKSDRITLTVLSPWRKEKVWAHSSGDTHTHSQFYKALLHITSVSRFYCTGLSDRGNFGTIQNFKNDPFTLNSKLFFLTISLNLI